MALQSLGFCVFSPQSQISLKSLVWKNNSCCGGWGLSRASPSLSPLAPEGKLKLFSFPNNALLQFVSFCFVCLAPFVPQLTPWIVVVAVVILALGFLTIGSIFFTWRLYKERSREQKSEFGSKGKSQCPQSFFSQLPEKWDSGLFQQERPTGKWRILEFWSWTELWTF